MSDANTNFYEGEIRRALDEQSFGIKQYTVLETSTTRARASVTLLEGSVIIIELTSQGYIVRESLL
jgi:hypothetical protein